MRTSGRRVRGTKDIRILASLLRMGFTPGMLRDRSSIQNIWYESDRGADDGDFNPVIVQIANLVKAQMVLNFRRPAPKLGGVKH